MVRKILLILLILYNLLYQVHGDDDCVPDSVLNMIIASNGTLFWNINPFETCDVTNFVIDIIGDEEETHHFNVTENFVDLSFLEICKQLNFTVTPVSHGVAGVASVLTAYVPLPPDVDLSISYFRFTFSGRNIILEWDLTNQTFGDCSLEYRLTLQDLDRGTMEDVYVEGKSALLDRLSPCITYEMNIRVVNLAYPMTEGPLRRMNLVLSARVQDAPTLKSVDVQATSFNMTWALEGDANRCPLRTFFVDGGIYFNTSVPLQNLLDPAVVSVEINSLRPNSMYSFRVYVENSRGMSSATPIAVQTLDLSPN